MEGHWSGSGGGKRVPCRHWSKGRCDLGDSCKFLHVGQGGAGQYAPQPHFVIGGRVGKPGHQPAGRVKTVICKKWAEPEGCPYGDKCTFAHGEGELQQRVGEAEDGAAMRNPLYKTVLCEQFREAEFCERAERCSFAHGQDELRSPAAAGRLGYKTTLCRNWESGNCTYGSACQFAHGDGELQQAGAGPAPGAAPGRVGPQYKTTLCKQWGETGHCQYGVACLFAHGDCERRGGGGSGEHQYKTVLCKNWEAEGRCQWGEQCKWAHGREDLNPGRAGRPGQGGPGPASHWNGQYKTVLCSKWGQGLCTYGQKCMFAHGPQELRSAGAGGGQGKVSSPQYKTVLCQQFMEHGGCQFSDSCSFAHGQAEVRNVQQNLAQLNPNYKGSLCKYFMSTGECEFGTICQYAHGNMELRTAGLRNPALGGAGNQNYSHIASAAGPSSPQWKTTLCKNYQEDGRCEFGQRCQFAHGQLELRTLAQNYMQLNPQYKTILCSHFAEGGSGNCPQGNNCQFSHGPHELRLHSALQHGGPPQGVQQAGYGAPRPQMPPQQQGKPVKVVLCERFSQGHCDRGDACQFAHGLQELHTYRARQVPNYKTTLCKSWSAAPGSCEYGETCMYAHGTSELRTMYPSEQGKDFQAGNRRSEEAGGLPGVPDTKRMRM